MQDGFFDGELMDGRRGLVPSNFIQKVPGICDCNAVLRDSYSQLANIQHDFTLLGIRRKVGVCFLH